MNTIVGRNDEVVTVEPQVSQVIVRIAGLTIFVRRDGSEAAPTVSVDAWDDGTGFDAGEPLASLEVPAPADTYDPVLRDYYERVAGRPPRRPQ